MSIRFIGRECEQRELKKIFASSETELVAVYGRRRVGKTFLIRSFFENKPCNFFQVVGIKDGALSVQLKEFTEEIARTFYGGQVTRLQVPKNWMEAFAMLTEAIKILSQHKKIVLFLMNFPGWRHVNPNYYRHLIIIEIDFGHKNHV